jgi:hypothetical protein
MQKRVTGVTHRRLGLEGASPPLRVSAARARGLDDGDARPLPQASVDEPAEARGNKSGFTAHLVAAQHSFGAVGVVVIFGDVHRVVFIDDVSLDVNRGVVSHRWQIWERCGCCCVPHEQCGGQEQPHCTSWMWLALSPVVAAFLVLLLDAAPVTSFSSKPGFCAEGVAWPSNPLLNINTTEVRITVMEVLTSSIAKFSHAIL